MNYYYFSFAGMISIWSVKHQKFFLKNSVRYPVFLISIGYFSTYFFSSVLKEFQYHLFTMILFALLLGCLSVKKIHFFEHRITNHLGKISYGIYMYHPIVFQLIGFVFFKLIPMSTFSELGFILVFNFLVFSITIVTAHFSYMYYESYFLNKKYITIKKN